MSTLVSRNITLQDRRTSVRLEPAMWDALDEVCRREERTIHELCTMVDRQRRESKLTAAVRVFVMAYFRAASTDQGHAEAGHGLLKGEGGDGKVQRRSKVAESQRGRRP